jgi:hypothetical protein
MRFILILWTSILLYSNASANNISLENLYINPEYQNRSEAIIFYNSANTCENCYKTIHMLADLLTEQYSDLLNIYLIDEQKHPEFISAFKLKGPITLTLIKISDHASFQHQNLQGLQSYSFNFNVFNRRVTQFIDNFFNFKIKN